MCGRPAAQWVYHIIYKIQQFVDKDPCIYFFFLSEIDKVAVDAIPAGTPFILVYQGARILDIVHILTAQFVDLYANGLEKRGDTNGLVHRHRDVADAELHGVEERVNPK